MERYTVGKRIGVGSFGQAFLAVDLQGARVVMKRVPLNGLSAEEVAAAKREGALLASIAHPCVNRLLDTFVDPASNELCLVSEYCAGGDLSRALEGAKGGGGSGGACLPLPAVLDLAVQLGLALLWLHRRKMLHRDIKPANIFVKGDGSYALGDFGIARQLKNTGELAKTVLGTPYYMAPELCEGRPYSFKADVWSYGVVLFEAAVGRKPFEGSSMQSLFRRILRGRVDYPPGLHLPLVALLNSALNTSTSARPPLLDLLRSDLLRPTLNAFVEKMGAIGIEVPGLDALKSREGESSGSSGSSASAAASQLQSVQPMSLKVQQQQQQHPPRALLSAASPSSPSPPPALATKPLLLPQQQNLVQQYKTPSRVLGAPLPLWREDPAAAGLPEPPPIILKGFFSKNPAPPPGANRASPISAPASGGGAAAAAAAASAAAAQHQLRSPTSAASQLPPAHSKAAPHAPGGIKAWGVAISSSEREGKESGGGGAGGPAAIVGRSRANTPTPRPAQLHADADRVLPHGTPVRAVPALAAAAAAAAAGKGGGAGGAADPALRAAAGEFQLNDHTLQLPAVGPKDPLVYRIQCLRVYLANAMEGGEKGVLELVRRVEKRRGVDSKDLCRTVKACLSDKDRALLPLVFQLIEAQQEAFSDKIYEGEA